MEILVHLPDDLAQRPNPGRDALESLPIEGYRTGALCHDQAGQLQGFSRVECDSFLEDRQIDVHAYGMEHLDEDRETLRPFQEKGLLRK